MLCIKILNCMWEFIKRNKYTIGLVLSVFLYTTDAFAVFESLKGAGDKIFEGLSKVIYPAATIGIACVCIAGMFGNFNWKWLVAILIGLFVIANASKGLDGGPGVADLAGIK